MVHKIHFSCPLRYVDYDMYQPFDEEALVKQTENDWETILKLFVIRASRKIYIDCNCGSCVVCEDLEDDIQEWSSCGIDYNSFNRDEKDTLEGIRRLFENLSFNCFWSRIHLGIVADHHKTWLRYHKDIERNNRHIEISRKRTTKYDNILFKYYKNNVCK